MTSSILYCLKPLLCYPKLFVDILAFITQKGVVTRLDAKPDKSAALE